MKCKEILAAGLVRDVLFKDRFAASCYFEKLRGEYRILDAFFRDDGSIIYRILTGYNASPLIDLYVEG